MITAKNLKAIAPQAKASLLEPLAKAMNLLLPAYDIDTQLRVCHFIAQAAHESAGFKTLVEYWGPTAAQKRYEGRKDLGNTQPGDGKRFMGRGIFQLTGRANYRTIGKKIGLALEANPELAAEPYNSVKIACEYWVSRKLNAKADKDDVLAVSIGINGKNKSTGLPNGLPDRKAYLARAKSVIKWVEEPAPQDDVTEVITDHVVDPVDVILTPKSGRDLIVPLQRLLTEKNYGKLNPDGDWGELTSMAVVALQSANQLPLNATAINWDEAQKAKVFVSEARKEMTMTEVANTPTEAGEEINKTSLVQAGGAGVALVTGGKEIGIFDWVGRAAEKITGMQPAIEVIGKAWEFVSGNFGWVLLAGGIGVFLLARSSKFKIFDAFKRGD